MSKINTTDILDGITLALQAAFTESRIYGEEVSQGLNPGDFIVILVTAGQSQLVGARCRRFPVFDVLYFPKNGEIECYDVADELYNVLDIITLPTSDMLRGTNMSYEIIDRVLHFHINYNHIVRRGNDEIEMEEFEIEQGG